MNAEDEIARLTDLLGNCRKCGETHNGHYAVFIHAGGWMHHPCWLRALSDASLADSKQAIQ